MMLEREEGEEAWSAARHDVVGGFLPTLNPRLVPRMKVDERSTVKDLLKWDQMYKSRFFNPRDRIVTGEDVRQTLAYQEDCGSPFSGLDTNYFHQWKTGLRPRHFPPINQRAHVHKTSLHLTRLPPPSKTTRPTSKPKPSTLHEGEIQPRSSPCPAKEIQPRSSPIPEKEVQPKTSLLPEKEINSIISKTLKNESIQTIDSYCQTKPVISSSTPLKKIHIPSRQFAERSEELLSLEERGLVSDFEFELMFDGRERRLRKPRMVVPSSGEAVKPCSIDGTEADAWCAWNYVTHEDDAPYTPNSFYVHNYPLLLMRIPKRSEDEQETDQSWWPVRNTPDIDLSYFDRLPTRHLSWDSFSSESDSEIRSESDSDSDKHSESDSDKHSESDSDKHRDSDPDKHNKSDSDKYSKSDKEKDHKSKCEIDTTNEAEEDSSGSLSN